MITFPQIAWISHPDKFHNLDLSNEESCRNLLSVVDNLTDMTSMGWVRVGTVTGTLKLEVTKSDIIAGLEAALNEAIQKVKADHNVKLGVLQAQLGKLLSLEFEA